MGLTQDEFEAALHAYSMNRMASINRLTGIGALARGVPAEEVKEEPKTVAAIYAELLDEYNRKRSADYKLVGTRVPCELTIQHKAEPQRPALDWNKPTSFDPFAGYVTVSDTDPQPKQALSPLQRTSEGERIPGFGSAALLKVR